MANETQNYHLKKPLEEEFYNIDDHNGNMDKIDAELFKRVTKEEFESKGVKTTISIMYPTLQDDHSKGYKSGDTWMVPKTELINTIKNYMLENANDWAGENATLSALGGVLHIKGSGTGEVVSATTSMDMELIEGHKCVVYLELKPTNPTVKKITVSITEAVAGKQLMEAYEINTPLVNVKNTVALVFEIPSGNYVNKPVLKVDTQYYSAAAGLDMVTEMEKPVVIDMSKSVDKNVVTFEKDYAIAYFGSEGAKGTYTIFSRRYVCEHGGNKSALWKWIGKPFTWGDLLNGMEQD